MNFWETLETLDNQMEVVNQRLRNAPPSIRKSLYGIGFTFVRFGHRKMRAVAFCVALFIVAPIIAMTLFWLANETNTTSRPIIYMNEVVAPGETMYAYHNWLVIAGKTLLALSWFYTLITITVAYAAFDIALKGLQKAVGYVGNYISEATVRSILAKVKSIVAWAMACYFLFTLLPFHRIGPIYMFVMQLLLGTAAWFRMAWLETPPIWAQQTFNKMVTIAIASIVFGLILMGVFPAAYTEYKGNQCEKVMTASGEVRKKDPTCEEAMSGTDSLGYWVASLGIGIRRMVVEGADWMRGKETPTRDERTGFSRPGASKSAPVDHAAQSEDERLKALLEHYE